MKTPQLPKENQSAPNKRKFNGTSNPRQLRAKQAMLRRPISRQELDSVAGCTNGPDLIAALRALGLIIECDRIKSIDRDGKPVVLASINFPARVSTWLMLGSPSARKVVQHE